MNASGIPVHSRTSPRTLLIAVSGFGFAALVTSFSVLAVNSFEAAVQVAVVGGAAVLGVSTVVVAFCARLMRHRGDRLTWTTTAVGLALTTSGSALRAGSYLPAWDLVPTGVAETVYAAGGLVLVSAVAAWPWMHRAGRSLSLAFGVALGVTVTATAAFWSFGGSNIAAAAFRSGSVESTRVLGSLGFLVFVLGAAVFSLASSVHLRFEPRVAGQVLLAAGLFAMVAGDTVWLWKVASPGGWAPGSLGDFTHLGSHVLFATGASLALDIGRSDLAPDTEGTTSG